MKFVLFAGLVILFACKRFYNILTYSINFFNQVLTFRRAFSGGKLFLDFIRSEDV